MFFLVHICACIEFFVIIFYLPSRVFLFTDIVHLTMDITSCIEFICKINFHLIKYISFFKYVLVYYLKNQTMKRKFMVPKFKVGDRVRISKYKKTFTKGYLPNWTNEVFTVHSIKPSVPKTYILKDNKGEILAGSFYEQEISKARYGDIYLIEKIIRQKGDKVLVRWSGFDKTHDSWIDKKNII